MEKDKFDFKMIDIEQKAFELSMLMSLFAAEIIETFNGSVDIDFCIGHYIDNNYVSLNIERVLYNDDSIALISPALDSPILWDDLSISAKDIVINELHHKYKSKKLYEQISDNEKH